MYNIDAQNPQSSPQARANRLKRARKIAGLTVREMTDNEHINYNTFCGWEQGKYGGLTEKGAEKVIERLDKAGVLCTTEWLLYGTGEVPILIDPALLVHKAASLKTFIQKQIEFFKQIYPDFLGIIIENNAMMPEYNIGDFVCGMPLAKEKILLANGKDVIVQLEDGSTLIRKLAVNPENNSLFLIANNFKYPVSVLQNVKIIQWALVLCHLKYDSLYD